MSNVRCQALFAWILSVKSVYHFWNFVDKIILREIHIPDNSTEYTYIQVQYIPYVKYPWQFHRLYTVLYTVYIYTLCEISLTISLNIYIHYIYLMWNITVYIYIPYVKYPWQFHWIYIYSINILCEISLNIYIFLMWNIPDNFTEYIYTVYISNVKYHWIYIYTTVYISNVKYHWIYIYTLCDISLTIPLL